MCLQRVCDCSGEVEGDGGRGLGSEMGHHGCVFGHELGGGVVFFGEVPGVFVVAGGGHGWVELEGGEEEREGYGGGGELRQGGAQAG